MTNRYLRDKTRDMRRRTGYMGDMAMGRDNMVRGGYDSYSGGRDYYSDNMMGNDYRRNDYHGSGSYDFQSGMESDENPTYDEYIKELQKFIKKLERKARFNMSCEQVIASAKNMGAEFKEYSKEEFYAQYLMEITDHTKDSNDPSIYIQRAIDFFEDDDIRVSPSEKMYIYFNYIVLGKPIYE